MESMFRVLPPCQCNMLTNMHYFNSFVLSMTPEGGYNCYYPLTYEETETFPTTPVCYNHFSILCPTQKLPLS